MSLTLEDVLTVLEPDEPDYRGAAGLGAEAGAHLLTIVQGDDPRLAARAAYLAGLIGDEHSHAAVLRAARSEHEVVRVAAASVLPRLGGAQLDEIADQLATDPDPSVRKVVARALAARPQVGTGQWLHRMAREDPDPALRELAAALARDLHDRDRRAPAPGQLSTG